MGSKNGPKNPARYFLVSLRAKNKRGHWMAQIAILGDASARECVRGSGPFAAWEVVSIKPLKESDE